MILHGYFRSSAAWRVRLALALKGLSAAQVAHHLRRGEQRDPAYLRLQPQGLLPALELEAGGTLIQSLAICEYLEEMVPEPPLLPVEAVRRAHVRAFALAIACDIHPLQNLKVLTRLRGLGLDEPTVTGWAHDIIHDGLAACETLLQQEAGPFCFGTAPTLADICLVPQLFNARRFGVEMRWPRLLGAEAACLTLPAFRDTAPDRQPDAE